MALEAVLGESIGTTVDLSAIDELLGGFAPQFTIEPLTDAQLRADDPDQRALAERRARFEAQEHANAANTAWGRPTWSLQSWRRMPLRRRNS